MSKCNEGTCLQQLPCTDDSQSLASYPCAVSWLVPQFCAFVRTIHRTDLGIVPRCCGAPRNMFVWQEPSVLACLKNLAVYQDPVRKISGRTSQHANKLEGQWRHSISDEFPFTSPHMLKRSPYSLITVPQVFVGFVDQSSVAGLRPPREIFSLDPVELPPCCTKFSLSGLYRTERHLNHKPHSPSRQRHAEQQCMMHAKQYGCVAEIKNL